MNILLDTHVFLWALSDDARLSPQARERIADRRKHVYVSSVSVAEISIKSALGKLRAPEAVGDAIRASGFEPLDFSVSSAERLRSLPWHHRDPFDRMLVAQAMDLNLELLSFDSNVNAYFT